MLVNGDRIAGEIEELNFGELSVKTDSLGTVQIRRLDIARIESKQTFYVDSAGLSRGRNPISAKTVAKERVASPF